MNIKSIIFLIMMALPGLILHLFDLFPIQVYLFVICLPPILFASVIDPIIIIYRIIFLKSRTAYFRFTLDEFIENIFSLWILLMLGFTFYAIRFSAEEWVRDLL